MDFVIGVMICHQGTRHESASTTMPTEALTGDPQETPVDHTHQRVLKIRTQTLTPSLHPDILPCQATVNHPCQDMAVVVSHHPLAPRHPQARSQWGEAD